MHSFEALLLVQARTIEAHERAHVQTMEAIHKAHAAQRKALLDHLARVEKQKAFVKKVFKKVTGASAPQISRVHQNPMQKSADTRSCRQSPTTPSPLTAAGTSACGGSSAALVTSPQDPAPPSYKQAIGAVVA